VGVTRKHQQLDRLNQHAHKRVVSSPTALKHAAVDRRQATLDHGLNSLNPNLRGARNTKQLASCVKIFVFTITSFITVINRCPTICPRTLSPSLVDGIRSTRSQLTFHAGQLQKLCMKA
jgi:hypothetical protein